MTVVPSLNEVAGRGGRVLWELLAASRTGTQGGATTNCKGSTAAHQSFYGEAKDSNNTGEDGYGNEV